MIDPTRIQIKRIYDLPAEDDGFRVLVDRLWPRGLKSKLHALTCGQRTLPQRRNYASGSTTPLTDSLSLPSDTRKNLR